MSKGLKHDDLLDKNRLGKAGGSEEYQQVASTNKALPAVRRISSVITLYVILKLHNITKYFYF